MVATTTPPPKTRMITTGTTRMRVRAPRTWAVVRAKSENTNASDSYDRKSNVNTCERNRGVHAAFHVALRKPRWRPGRDAVAEQAGRHTTNGCALNVRDLLIYHGEAIA